MQETQKQNISTNFLTLPEANSSRLTNNAGVLINLQCIQLLQPYPTSLFLDFWLWKRDKLNIPLYTF